MIIRKIGLFYYNFEKGLFFLCIFVTYSLLFLSMSQYNINELIQSFLSKNNKTTLFKERTVVEIWHQVMGDFIAKQTRSVSMKNGILYVSLTNASLRFELMGMRSALIDKLNEEVGFPVVKDIIVR